MNHISFFHLWEHLEILLRFYLTDAVFLLAMTGLWKLVSPTLKRAGHIKALYRLLLLTEAAVFLFLAVGIIQCLIPIEAIGFTEIFRGQYSLSGIGCMISTCIILAGCAVQSCGKAKAALRTVRSEKKMRMLCYPVGDRDKIASYHELGQLLGLSRLPDLWENPGYVTPCISGVCHPVIVVPFDVFTEEEQRLAMSHELVHYKKKDIFFRKADTLLGILFWMIPQSSKRHSELVLLQEILCDVYVCEHFKGEAFARDYYADIMNMMLRKTQIRSRELFEGAGLMESPSQLVNRAENYVNIRAGKRRYALVTFLGIFFLAGSLLLSYAQILPPDVLSWHPVKGYVYSAESDTEVLILQETDDNEAEMMGISSSDEE